MIISFILGITRFRLFDSDVLSNGLSHSLISSFFTKYMSHYVIFSSPLSSLESISYGAFNNSFFDHFSTHSLLAISSFFAQFSIIFSEITGHVSKNIPTVASLMHTQSSLSFVSSSQWIDILQAPFMIHAFIAGTLISISAGIIGYFTIGRRSTFAAHSLGHIGLPGATGAVLLGLPVDLGLGLFTLLGAAEIATFGKKISRREVATGTILAFSLALGLFFARLSTSASEQLQSILFGSILTVTPSQLWIFFGFDIVLLIIMWIIYQPLLFSSVDEQIARAKGVPTQFLNYLFMFLLAGVVTISVQAVGTLLIFALIITPAAAANLLARSPLGAIIIACVICFLSISLGLLTSVVFPAPPSFLIVSFSTVIWLIALGIQFYLEKRKRILFHSHH